MEHYPISAVEEAMKRQEIILKAISGEIRWIDAADVLGMTPRNVRRLRKGYEKHGYEGLIDRRRRTPNVRRTPINELEKILGLYREKYAGFNVRHFHQTIVREHGIKQSYTMVKNTLQEAGLVKKKKTRGRHRRRRERRAHAGEMLHIDGSKHAWLSLIPDEKQMLIVCMDDATSELLYAQLWPEETTEAVFWALKVVLETRGIPAALYTDRASWAFHTPKAGGKVDKEQLTQVGRALKQLGIEHIPAYSPQARGRSERINRTLQDRLVNELRVAGIKTVTAANRYITQRFIPSHNSLFACEPANPTSAFVPLVGVDLTHILCWEESRKVRPDNTVVMKNIYLQIAKQPGRATCARMLLTVRRHLDQSFSVWKGATCMGIYDPKGEIRGPGTDFQKAA